MNVDLGILWWVFSRLKPGITYRASASLYTILRLRQEFVASGGYSNLDYHNFLGKSRFKILYNRELSSDLKLLTLN